MEPPDHPLLRSIASWAAAREDVLAVVVRASRTPQDGTGDSVADFDVDLHVDDPAALAGEEWLEEIAPVLVAGDEDEEDGVPGRLVFFAGQQRVDLRLRTGTPADGTPTLYRRGAANPDAARPARGRPPAGPARAVVLGLAPVLSAPDVPALLGHYRALGFDVREDPDGGGSASRDGLELRMAEDAVGVPGARGLVRAAVDDADALHREWASVPGGRTVAPGDRPDGTREGSHTDPAGNVIRFFHRR
jgi:hypothetical protein